MENLKALRDLTTNYPFLVVGVMLLLIGAIGAVPLGANKFPILGPWPWILLFIGVLLMAIDVVRYLRRTPSTKESLDGVEGTITRPSNNDAVTRIIDTGGSVKNVENYQHLWLVIEVGKRTWPKAGEIQADKSGAWQRRVFEDGTGDEVSLSLLAANEHGHKKIEEWLNIGPLIGYHPFEVDVPGTRRLARVEGLRKRSNP